MQTITLGRVVKKAAAARSGKIADSFAIEGRVRNKGELRRGRRKNINCGQMRGRGEGEAKSGLGWIVGRENAEI